MSTPPSPQTEGLPKTFYAFSENGSSFERVEVRRTPLADVDSQLRALSQEIPTAIQNVFVIPAGKVHMCLSNKLFTLITPLKEIPLLTYWTVVKPPDKRTKAWIAPTFVNNASSFRASPVWCPPKDMRLFIMSHYNMPEGLPRWARSSLVAVSTDPENKRHYKLPLPNIFANCKLCLGRDIVPLVSAEIIALPLADQMQKSIEMFTAGEWNTDLLNENDPAVTNAVFRFSADDNKTQLDVPTEWPSLLVSVSNSDFNGIPFHSIL